jgi:hypothetical protein
MNLGDTNISQFTTEEEKRKATAEIADRIAKVMFFFLEEEMSEELDLENEGKVMDFTDYLWTITCASLSAININVFGKDQNGHYIASIEPCVDAKDFLIKEDIGIEEHVFWEDLVEDIAPDVSFGRHDEKLMHKIGY